MNKYFLILISILQLHCQVPKPININYKYPTLSDLAAQNLKVYKLPHNGIHNLKQRASILRAFNGDSTENGWKEINNSYLIQPIAGYLNRYLIADTSRYFIELMDIEADSITILNNLHGKYLGVLADTNAVGHAINGKIIVLEPHHCEVKEQGRNYSNVIILYAVKEKSVLPVEILDFKCYDGDLRDAVLGCFCGMDRDEFKKQLLKDIIFANQYPFPTKIKRVTK